MPTGHNSSRGSRARRSSSETSKHCEDPDSQVRDFDSPTKHYLDERHDMDGFGGKAFPGINPNDIKRGSHITKVEDPENAKD